MKQLPNWRLTSKFPAFYDTESGSAIEMTAKVYGAMQELINEYNEFVVELTKQITAFEGETKADIEAFKECVSETITNYIKTIDSKITLQDLKIQEAIQYFNNNLSNTVNESVNEVVSTLVIEQIYNDETEAMDLIIKTGGNEQ